MIQRCTRLKVADNTGAQEAICIGILGGTGRRIAKLGDTIIVSIREATPDSTIKKGEIAKAVIVRARKETRRKDGTYIRFDDNSVVLIDNQKNPRGTRIFGPVARELRNKNYMKIISLAPEVV